MLLPSVRRAKLSGDCSKAFSHEGPLSVLFAILGGLPAASNLARFRAQATVGLLDYHECYYFYWSVNMFSVCCGLILLWMSMLAILCIQPKET